MKNKIIYLLILVTGIMAVWFGLGVQGSFDSLALASDQYGDIPENTNLFPRQITNRFDLIIHNEEKIEKLMKESTANAQMIAGMCDALHSIGRFGKLDDQQQFNCTEAKQMIESIRSQLPELNEPQQIDLPTEQPNLIQEAMDKIPNQVDGYDL